MTARDDRLRQVIDDKRRKAIVREMADAGDVEAIRETFVNDFGVITSKPGVMNEVIRRVDSRLAQGEDNTYHVYKDTAEDILDEINPRRKSESEKTADVIDEMAAMRVSNPEHGYARPAE